jgi:hypothetical protein
MRLMPAQLIEKLRAIAGGAALLWVAETPRPCECDALSACRKGSLSCRL